MHMRSLVLAAIGSFLCGSAASVAPDSVRSTAVAFNQSTLLRLHDTAPGEPGPLKSHDKAAGTTPSVGPRLLSDSAVNVTGLDNEQSEERGFFPEPLHRLSADVMFRIRRFPGSVFKTLVRLETPLTTRATTEWLEHVNKIQAKISGDTDKALFQQLKEKLPFDRKVELLDSLAQVATEMHAATSRRPSPAFPGPSFDKPKAILLKPKAALELFRSNFILTEPGLAVNWIRYNEAIRRVDPDSAVPLDEIASQLFVHLPHKDGAVPDGHTKAIYGLLTLLREKTPVDELDNMLEVINELKTHYDNVLKSRGILKDSVATNLEDAKHK